MSNAPRDEYAVLFNDFRNALEDCEDIYHAAALVAQRENREQIPAPVGTFVSRMLDLHRGLLIKTVMEVAQVDHHWNARELELASALFRHVWEVRLEGEKLREALRGLHERNDLSWDVLLGPFTWLPPFQERSEQIHTVVLRVANLVAKADGRVKPAELRQLQWIEREMERILQPIPLVGTERPGSVRVIDVPPLPGSPAVSRPGPSQRSGLATPLSGSTPAPSSPETQAEALAKALGELDEMIGLNGVKEDIRGLVNFLKVQQARADFDLPRTRLSLHAVFSGNPGTGKTTVARLLGRIFGAMGLLAQGQLIETDRSGLVAEYAGQTAPKTNKRIDEALDGVLFIDEAYSLAAEKGDDPFGAEALQTLLKRMEDDRERLLVVLAGYPAPLDRLLKSNPGLSSRFSRQLVFPDYSAPDLCRIFEVLCTRNRYELPAATRYKLLLGLDHLVRCRDEHFGNARLARNTFERAIRRLANRIAGLAPLTHALLTRIEPEDIEMEGIAAHQWTDLEKDAPALRATCSECKQVSGLTREMLGQNVRCPRCAKTFLAAWAELKRE